MESKCKRCSEVFGSVETLIILEEPSPEKKCTIKDRPEHSLTLFSIVGLAIFLVGCGISEEEYEKKVSELKHVKAKLAKTEVEVKETKARLNQAKMKNAEMERALTEAHNQLKIALRKQKQNKEALEAPLIAARNEAVYLRQKLEELTQNLLRTASELEMTKDANEILREQMSELNNRKYELEEQLQNLKFSSMEPDSKVSETQFQAREVSVEWQE